jgi:hypothetical protein
MSTQRPAFRTLAIALLATCAFVVPSAASAAAPTIWATVNVCDTANAPNTLGLRGSMPGSSRKGATMWMRFTGQYRSSRKTWKSVAALDTGYLRIGSAKVGSRQAGHSFRVKAPAKGNSFLLRGLLSFQWRTKKGKAFKTVRRYTTAGHQSSAGADPPGYSAATCRIR